MSKERAKELDILVRSSAAGPNHVRVELEFTAEGPLENFSRVDLRIHEGNELLAAAPLKEERPQPHRVIVSFLANLTHLDTIKLWVMVPNRSPGGSIYEVRVQEFIEGELQAADETSENPLSPETILKNKFEGKVTVEFQVDDVHSLDIDSLFAPDVSHDQIIRAEVPESYIDQEFVVVVAREIATRLLKLGIADSAEHFKGNMLRVSGTVERIKRPSPSSAIVYRIQVSDLDQLEIIRKP